jgi:hypothetical protein
LKAYRGSGGIAPLVLNPGKGWRTSYLANRGVVNMNAPSGDVRDALKPHIFPCINVVEGVGSSVGTSLLNMPVYAPGIRL